MNERERAMLCCYRSHALTPILCDGVERLSKKLAFLALCALEVEGLFAIAD